MIRNSLSNKEFICRCVLDVFLNFVWIRFLIFVGFVFLICFDLFLGFVFGFSRLLDVVT